MAKRTYASKASEAASNIYPQSHRLLPVITVSHLTYIYLPGLRVAEASWDEWADLARFVSAK